MCGYDVSHVNSTVSKLHANLVLYYMVHTLLEKCHSGQISCCQEPAFRQDSGTHGTARATSTMTKGTPAGITVYQYIVQSATVMVIPEMLEIH